MNFKRKKSKKQVRCTMCTHFRWMGNSKGRQKAKYYQKHKKAEAIGE